MAKNDFIFVDESGDTGYKLDPDTGELLSSPYFVLAALHVTDESIRLMNRHVAAFRFYTQLDRELKLPTEKEVFNRLLGPIGEMALGGQDIFVSVVYLDKTRYTGPHLKSEGARTQSSIRFRNYILRRLLESHFEKHQLRSAQYELILDRIDMNSDQFEDLRRYIGGNFSIPSPNYITHADSLYVECLQIVHHIASGFKNVVAGGDIPEPLLFVSERDIAEDGKEII